MSFCENFAQSYELFCTFGRAGGKNRRFGARVLRKNALLTFILFFFFEINSELSTFAPDYSFMPRKRKNIINLYNNLFIKKPNKMKKKLLLLCALMASVTGVWAAVVDTNVAEGATAKIGETEYANVLNNTGAQPNSYDASDNMEIVVDLGASKTIDAFSITFSGDRWVSQFTLSYSTDGGTYTKIADYTTGISSNTTTTIAKEFDTQVTAQYIKYTSAKSNKNETGDNYSETIRNFKLLQYGDAITDPTADKANVLVAYSAFYGYTSKDDNNASYGVNDMPGTLFTSNEVVTAGGKSILHVNGKGFNARAKAFVSDAWTATASADYTKAFLAIYPTTATAGRIFDDNNYSKATTFSVTPNQWNYVEVSAAALTNNFQLVVLDDETEFYLADYYLTKPAADAVEVTVSGNKAVIAGTVTAAKVDQIVSDAGNAAVLDFSGATVSEDITVNPTNTNAIVIVSGTDRTKSQTVSTTSGNNLVVYDGTWYRAATGTKIVITDDGAWANQPNYGISIDCKEAGYGYNITRSEVAAGKYVTTCLPFNTAVPAGAKAYTLSAATASSVTFAEISGTTLTAGTPYVLYAESAFTLTTGDVTGNDLNLSADISANNVEVSPVTMHGALQGQTGADDLSMWAMSSGVIRPFKSDAYMVAFRAYFTGLDASSASEFTAIFEDNDDSQTTKIGTINANGEIEAGEAYNLNGQRVAQPTKGLYIVNGKKVVLK